MRALKIGLATLALAAGSAFAAPVVWTVPSTTLSDGSVVSGTFTYDQATTTLTAINITSTGTYSANYTFVGGTLGSYVFGQATAVATTGAPATPAFAIDTTGIPATLGAYTTPRVYIGPCITVGAGLCSNLSTTPLRSASNVVLVAAPVVANTATVPTLSEYTMIALASLMAMGGIWTMRKRGKF